MDASDTTTTTTKYMYRKNYIACKQYQIKCILLKTGVCDTNVHADTQFACTIKNVNVDFSVLLPLLLLMKKFPFTTERENERERERVTKTDKHKVSIRTNKHTFIIIF